jgi:hypothetical protein
LPKVFEDTLISVKDVDVIIPYDEQLLEYQNSVSDEIAQKIENYPAVCLFRGDVHYVVTKYGIVYLHGKKHS